ncbi:MAG TPA: hypothetical protein VII61_18680 [Ktedonobacteraceae bacterium]
MQRWNDVRNQYASHDQATEPGFNPITAPLPINYLSKPSWGQRFLHGLGHFCVVLIRKINQLLGFALLMLILILLTRFLLHLFNVTMNVNLFTQGVALISDPLVAPFDHLFPLVPYQGYSIDVTTLVSMGIYVISTILLRSFLKLLVTKPK